MGNEKFVERSNAQIKQLKASIAEVRKGILKRDNEINRLIRREFSVESHINRLMGRIIAIENKHFISAKRLGEAEEKALGKKINALKKRYAKYLEKTAILKKVRTAKQKLRQKVEKLEKKAKPRKKPAKKKAARKKPKPKLIVKKPPMKKPAIKKPKATKPVKIEKKAKTEIKKIIKEQPKPTESFKGSTYRDENFSVKYPMWRPTKKASKNVQIALKKEPFEFELSSEGKGSFLLFEEYVEHLISKLKKDLGARIVIKEEVGNSYYLAYLFEKHGQTTLCKSMVSLSNNIIYIVSFKGPADRFPEISSTVVNSFSSISFS